jgi:Icc protein
MTGGRDRGANNGTIRLLQVTDTHLHASPQAMMNGVNVDASLRAVVESARGLQRPPDAVLATGDLVHDESRAGYKRLRSILGNLAAKVYCLPGNHDDPRIMREVFGPPGFQFCGLADFGHWCVVLLSTHLPGEDSGLLDPDALVMLDRTLSEKPDRHVLISLHHPPVPVGSPWLDEIGLENSADLLASISRHDNVRGVLCGHVHQAFDQMIDGVRFMATPSTCFQFVPFSDTFVVDRRPAGFRWLELDRDGGIRTDVERLSGPV